MLDLAVDVFELEELSPDDDFAFVEVEVLESSESLEELELRSRPVSAARLLRLSVLYQPLPLKTTGGALSWRWANLPQRSHAWVVGEPKGSRRS